MSNRNKWVFKHGDDMVYIPKDQRCKITTLDNGVIHTQDDTQVVDLKQLVLKLGIEVTDENREKVMSDLADSLDALYDAEQDKNKGGNNG